MRIFYDIGNKHLIVVPLRNGSSHIYSNAMKYKLIEVTHPPLMKSIIQDVEKKTFIYRDPFMRLLSYYNNFIYKVYKDKVKLTDIDVDDQKQRELLFKPKLRGEDLLSDIALAKEKITLNYKQDLHTLPQSWYFLESDFGENVEEYEIINVKQYSKWLFLTFGDKDTKPIQSAIDNTTITIGNFFHIKQIQDLCTTIYEDDYVFLEPNVIYL